MDAILRAKTGSGSEWDDPSEDLLFELFQDIDRGDEDFFTLERLDESAPVRVRITRSPAGLWSGFDDLTETTFPLGEWTELRDAHAWLTGWAFGIVVVPDAPLSTAFGIGSIVYAGQAMRFVVQDISAIVTPTPTLLPEDAARLVVVFAIPGRDFQGIRVSGFERKSRVVGIDVGVPASLTATDTSSYLRSTLSEAIDLAEAHLRKRKLPYRLDEARLAVESAIVELAIPALDERQRYRAVDRTHESEARVRTYVELDGAGRDLRRVDEYADRRLDYAIRAIATGSTRLEKTRLAERLAHDQGSPIPEADFEAVWQRAINQPTPRGDLQMLDDLPASPT